MTVVTAMLAQGEEENSYFSCADMALERKHRMPVQDDSSEFSHEPYSIEHAKAIRDRRTPEEMRRIFRLPPRSLPGDSPKDPKEGNPGEPASA